MQLVVAFRSVIPLLGMQTVFVHCDVADYSLLGDSACRMLRTVSIIRYSMNLIIEKFDISSVACSLVQF